MGLNFLETGTFEAKISPMSDFYYPQTKVYGPGFFLVLSSIYKLFGFGIFQTRIAGLIFGFITILTGFKILKAHGVKEVLCSSFVLLLLFDTIFLQNIHSGRMDSMALMFTFLGIFQVIKVLQNKKWINFILVGLFFGFALLTTPRIAVCLIGPTIILIVFFLYEPSISLFIKCLSVLLAILSLYSIWVVWGFGGPIEFYSYIFGAPKVKIKYESVAAIYISGNGYIPKFQIPAILLSAVLLISSLIIKRKYFDSLLWISILSLVPYYLLVKDTGIYSIFSIPYVYLIICISINTIFNNKILGTNLFFLSKIIIAINILIFISKNSLVVLFSSERKSESIQKQIENTIPKGSRVIGEEIYYYLVKRSGSEFQYLDRGADTYNRKLYHENKYDYQYVISRDPPANINEFNYYNLKGDFKLIHKIEKPEIPGFLIKLRSYLANFGIIFPKGYEGTIYLRQ